MRVDFGIMVGAGGTILYGEVIGMASVPIDRDRQLVFGDLISWVELPVKAPIRDAGKIYHRLEDLIYCLPCLYVSFVLSQVGYYVSAKDWRTSDFSLEDWAEKIGDVWDCAQTEWTGVSYLEAVTHYEPGEWNMEYENESGLKLRIRYLIELEEYPQIPENMEELLKVRYFAIDGGETEGKELDFHYWVVAPRLIREDKKAFLKFKEDVKEKLGEDLVFSIGEFTHKMVPDEEEKQKALAEWESIRQKVLRKVQTEYPAILRAIYDEQIQETREHLHQARRKYEAGNFDDAIRDAGWACEALLQVLYAEHQAEEVEGERVEFKKMLDKLHPMLDEQYNGKLSGNLDFVREWRNNVSHPVPGQPKPNDLITLQVLTHAQLFYDLFMKRTLG